MYFQNRITWCSYRSISSVHHLKHWRWQWPWNSQENFRRSYKLFYHGLLAKFSSEKTSYKLKEGAAIFRGEVRKVRIIYPLKKWQLYILHLSNESTYLNITFHHNFHQQLKHNLMILLSERVYIHCIKRWSQ